jgi:hypothetical protein
VLVMGRSAHPDAGVRWAAGRKVRDSRPGAGEQKTALLANWGQYENGPASGNWPAAWQQGFVVALRELPAKLLTGPKPRQQFRRQATNPSAT